MAESEDMIERIAICLWHRFGAPHQLEWQDESHKAEFRDAARAVIQEMREPTRPMWAHAANGFVNCRGRELHHDRACGLVWDYMLAAALEPELANHV